MYVEQVWEQYGSDDEEGEGCHIYAKIVVYNPNAGPASVTLSSPAGIFQPSTVVAAPGYNQFIVEFFHNAGFMGGGATVQFYAYIINDEGEIVPCFAEQRVDFPDPCPIFDFRKYKEEDSSLAFSIGEGQNSLKLAPNPATGHTTVYYQYRHQKAESRHILVYDLTGRAVHTLPVRETSGSLSLDLSLYAPGVYLVVMQENGQKLEYKKLIVK